MGSRVSQVKIDARMSREIITRLPLALQAEGAESYLPDEADRQIILLQQEVAKLDKQVVELQKTHETLDGRLAEADSRTRQLVEALELRQHPPEPTSGADLRQHGTAVLSRLLEELGQSLMQTLSELETALGRIMHPEALGLVQRCRDRLLILTDRILTLQRHADPLQNPWVPETDRLDLLVFFKELAYQQSLETASIRLFSSPRLQAVGQLDPIRFEEAALLLLQEVQRRNPDEEITVTLRKSGLDSSQLLVDLSGSADWELPETATLADFLKQRLEDSDTFGLDLLVAWDVLDRHGIALEFHREQERASGFSFSMRLHSDPVALPE